MEFLNLFELLQKQNIRYLLCGGLAVSIYGIPRTTADIDLLIDFEKENVSRFINTLKTISYVNTLPFSLEILVNEKTREDYIEHKNLIAYSFFNSRKNTFLIDVLVKQPFDFNDIWARKETREYENVIINLLSINDLILMKEKVNREQDKEDVILLSKLIRK